MPTVCGASNESDRRQVFIIVTYVLNIERDLIKLRLWFLTNLTHFYFDL